MSDRLPSIANKHFDVAIIGGGINGASAAQHLSAAGYRVIVLEQDDFAAGATSRSSRLLHCGLRHLASGSSFWQTLLQPGRLMTNLKTVRDDMLARDEIVQTIPERVRPINFCLPIYEDDEYKPWQLDLAFAALRLTSPKGVSLDYRRYSIADLGKVPVGPWLRDQKKLKSVAVFREYIFDWPERIALDALFDAEKMGAVLHNYVRVVDLKRSENTGWKITLESVEEAERACISADLVLNLAGAWVDEVAGKTGQNTEQKCMGMKGIHVALKLPEEFSDWGIFTYNSIDEPLYCLPFRGIHYVGLTRTPFRGEAADVKATDDEIDWMINEINRVMPRLSVRRKDILFTWAGVNPLTYDAEEPKGSREIKIHDLEKEGLPSMLSLTGGPIMTHRRVARKIVSQVSAKISPSKNSKKINYAASKNDSSLSSVQRICKEEMPHNLSDIMLRRLGLGWNPDQGKGEMRKIAEAAADELGWPSELVDQEVRRYETYLDTFRRKPTEKST